MIYDSGSATHSLDSTSVDLFRLFLFSYCALFSCATLSRTPITRSMITPELILFFQLFRTQQQTWIWSQHFFLDLFIVFFFAVLLADRKHNFCGFWCVRRFRWRMMTVNQTHENEKLEYTGKTVMCNTFAHTNSRWNGMRGEKKKKHKHRSNSLKPAEDDVQRRKKKE